MALGATVYAIEIDLSDSDRGVFESLALRVARHPSESEEYLVTRVLAYALEYAEGIAFSAGGLSDPGRAGDFGAGFDRRTLQLDRNRQPRRNPVASRSEGVTSSGRLHT